MGDIFKFFKHTPPLENRIDNAITILSQQKKKLEFLNIKIKNKEKILFNYIVSFIKQNNLIRAKIYANELAEIRKLIKNINKSILIHEQMILRLETIKEIEIVFSQLNQTLNAIKDVIIEVNKIMPELSSNLDIINNIAQDLIINTGVREIEQPIVRSSECNNIIKEASELLEERLKENIPIPPTNLNNKIDKYLIDYVKRKNGEFDINEFCKITKISKEEILRTIEKLSNKGLIRILVAEEALNGIYGCE
ncbi:MAG: Snf7 family protein [Candidatus Methanomethylicia archaeon]|nr:Snf7 family protein [Candidatus Methanomethylicia archaeon]